MKNSLIKNYSYLWITLVLFLLSVSGHWIFGWITYVDDQAAHHQPVETKRYVAIMLRDTFENWQSEFLQLIWQVGGLALFLCVGSPQSREGDARKEAKLDAIIRATGQDGERVIRQINEAY